MTENGYGVQVLKLTEEHMYELDEDILAQVLLHEDIKDLPVVVVSVAGAYRGGKSFLLNFFLRYLTSSPSDRLDGSWLSEDTEQLSGFKWQSGIKAITTGILLWSEPFIALLPSGEKVAVLLMDTQGTFDSKSTVRDCSTIFALSTLLSSVQIYNISQNIQEDDLQHLQLFTAYGKMVKQQNETKAFQVLEILVRDWQYPYNYPYGAVGGEQFLQEKLKITPDLPKELQELRIQLRSSFEKLSCFLMPHPGFKVLSRSFKGNISDISIEFKTQLNDLVASLFGQAKLMPKTVNGERIRAKDLFNYFKTYAALFNSDTIASPTSIMKATVEAGLLSTFNEAREIYENGMESEAGPTQLSVPAIDLQYLHKKYLAEAQTFFNSKKKMGSKEDAYKYLEKLNKNLEERLPHYISSNVGKIQNAINKANDLYDDMILEISKDKPLCVHPLDLEQIHKKGLDTAIKTFDEARKRVTDKTDDERTHFIENFAKRYELLQLSNQQNNKLAVDERVMEYWHSMQASAIKEPPLTSEEFQQVHDDALKKALDDFEAVRNIHNDYTKDNFKNNLIKVIALKEHIQDVDVTKRGIHTGKIRTYAVTAITDSLIQLKAIQKSVRKLAMQAALQQYDNYFRTVWNLGSRKCLHPNELERENERARCRALETFRPNKRCSDGFDNDDEDEATLQDILRSRYRELKSLNDSANETAVHRAFYVFISYIDEKCRISFWSIVSIALGQFDPVISNVTKRNEYFEEAKNKAIAVFFEQRLARSDTYEDNYKDKLVQMMTDYFNSKHNSPVFKAIGGLLKKLPVLMTAMEMTGQMQ